MGSRGKVAWYFWWRWSCCFLLLWPSWYPLWCGENRRLLWPGVAVRGCMGLTREGLSLHPRAMGVPGQCCGRPWGWFLPFLLPVWLLAERFGATIWPPALGAWLRWEAGGWAACPKVMQGECPDLLLPVRGQGTEMPPQLHNLHAQVQVSLEQHFPSPAS